MKLFILFTVLILSPQLYADQKKSNAQINIEAFDRLCIQNFEDFTNIKYMSKAFGGKEIPSNLKNADPVLRENNGNAYYIPYNGTNFMVGYIKDKSCSLSSKNIDHVLLKKLLVKNYNVILKHKDSMGVQTNEIYQVTKSLIHNGAIISLMYANSGTGYKEGTLSFIPSHIAKKIFSK